jgi:hypothetical protein
LKVVSIIQAIVGWRFYIFLTQIPFSWDISEELVASLFLWLIP